MKYDRYDLFESPDLRAFVNAHRDGGLSDLVKSGAELITPHELVSLQMEFEDKEDLDILREESGFETRAILLDKRACEAYENHYKWNEHQWNELRQKKPEIIIVPSKQIQTSDLTNNSRILSLENYNKLSKNALAMPDEIAEQFVAVYQSRKGIMDEKWKQKLLEFVLEGDQKLIQAYIKYNEEAINQPFYESFKVEDGGIGKDGILDWHLLRMKLGKISKYSFTTEGKGEIMPPTFQFNDTSNGIYFFGTRFIGITKELSKKIEESRVR